MKPISHHILALLATLLLTACSTTRVLPDGAFRLAENKVSVEGKRHFNTAALEPYIKQKPNSYFLLGWNPFLNIYNWSTPGKDTGWDRFVRKIGVAPVIYDPSLVEISEENIAKHLDYLGYYHSKVDADIDVKGKKVRVNYLVKLGKQFKINDIEYVLPEYGPFAADFLSDTSAVTVKRGDFLSESALEEETVRSSAVMRRMGYYGFSKYHYFYEADTLSVPGEASLQLTIHEYTRNSPDKEAEPLRKFSFGQVNLFHPASLRIRENILRELNTIHPGSPYSEDVVNNTYTRLSSMRVFSSVNVELSQSDTSTVDCEINLSPSKLQGFKANLETSTNSSGLLGISPELSYFHKNIFHGGEWLNLSFMGNFQFKLQDKVRSTEFGFSAGISLPRFLFIPYSHFEGAIPRTEIKASYNYQNRPEYQRNILSTSYGYSGVHKQLYYQFYPVKLNIVRLGNIDPGFYTSLSNNPFMMNAYRNHFDLGTGGTLFYTTDASVVPHGSYHYARFQLDVAGNVLSAFRSLMPKDASGSGRIWGTPFSQYVRAEASFGKTWTLGASERMTLATRLLAGAGYAYGNSSALPFEQQFYAGGASSMRGWQARSVGPGFAKPNTTFVIPNQTGDMKLEANAEMRFPMFWKVGGAVFVDAGNVWTIHDTRSSEGVLGKFTDFYKSIALDTGFGVRLDLGFILIRLDAGMILHDPSRDAGMRWVSPLQWLQSGNSAIHFGVGYPF